MSTRGASDWGRFIYVLRDAKGERWTSIGAKDDYNCNDIHAWSSFNFDGWRYLGFELPGHIGWDNFRKHGTTWWRSDDGDAIVDLPLALKPPEHYYDGTRKHVLFEEVPGAKAYHVWVGAHADGRGAVNLVPTGIKNGDLVTGLRPKLKLYYWITYTDAQDKISKPSPVHAEVTVDNFKEK